MTLAGFIRTHQDDIEREWDNFARRLTPAAAGLNPSTLRDHLPEILDAIASYIDSPEPERLNQHGSSDRDQLDRIAARHAAMRLNSGFDLEHIVAEYGALRAGTATLWSQTLPAEGQIELNELMRLNAWIDQAIAQLMRRYTRDSTQFGDRFISILVHDLRSPLNLINMAAGAVLETGSLTEPQVSNISRIFRGVRRIDRLVNDLAVVVRSRVGQRLPLNKARADLGVICEQAVEEVKASYGNVAVHIKRTGNLMGEWDPDRIAQVVSNLVVNAIVHASANEVDVAVIDSGPAVVIKVSNKGNPIAASMLKSIFEPLIHKDRSPSQGIASGLGLGLFIVREISTAHRGSVEVTSSEAEGTTFTVTLPRL